MDTLTDEQLMERLHQGQTSALDELYRRYAKRLYAFCQNMTRSQGAQDPEDLVQDVFVRVIKAAHTFDPQKASFRTWLFTIARNHCLDVLRRRGIIKFLPIGRRSEKDKHAQELVPEEALVDPKQNVEGSILKASVVAAVRDCIDELQDQEEKQAIVLYYLGSKVYREIGAVLGKSTSTAKNRVEAARAKVKRCLERKGIDSIA